MRKLVSTGEAAQVLGLSLQGVHYRIKKGQLKSMKKDGKTYVYVEQEQVDQYQNNQHIQNPQVVSPSTTQTYNQQTIVQDSVAQDIPESQKKLYDLVFQAKDDQIKDLKENIDAVKEQYKSEINRLDQNQKQILDVFQSEIDLLKSAFHEMKNVYQLEHSERVEFNKLQFEMEQQQKQQEYQASRAFNDEESEDSVETPFMDIKEFHAYMRSFKKSNAQIKNMILERVKAGDKRFIYKKNTKEVIIFRSDFMDLI